jgi:magnesium transporter
MTQPASSPTQKRARTRAKPAGLPPGSMVHVGEQKIERVRISRIRYDEQGYEEDEPSATEPLAPAAGDRRIVWINVAGLHQIDVIDAIGKAFGVHPLALEDIVHAGQRPKLDDYERQLFVVLNALQAVDDQHINVEQVSLLVGPNYVVSFQERDGALFDPVRDRIKAGKGRCRKLGADYLAYALLDTVVDHYFVVLERFSEMTERLEETLIRRPDPNALGTLHGLKRQMILLRKSIWPLREVVSGLQRGESPLITDATRLYLRDVYDHTVRVIDTVETLRDLLSGMLDIYLSSLSYRLNEVMKVLTIIATIFIPLTFLTSIYGMNFMNMPELKWPWGYPALWLLMLSIGGGMLYYFRKKRWL